MGIFTGKVLLRTFGVYSKSRLSNKVAANEKITFVQNNNVIKPAALMDSFFHQRYLKSRYPSV